MLSFSYTANAVTGRNTQVALYNPPSLEFLAKASEHAQSVGWPYLPNQRPDRKVGRALNAARGRSERCVFCC